jgi:alginate O-acetyltransferase complex protein AlgI
VFAAPGTHSAGATWLALMAFVGQIYFDFASYASIAIGTSRMFGIRLRRISPAAGVGVDRRFLEPLAHDADAVVPRLRVPAAGRVPQGRTPRDPQRHDGAGVVRFWHGARWNFVFWGAYHAVLLTATTCGILPKRRGRRAPKNDSAWVLGLSVGRRSSATSSA